MKGAARRAAPEAAAVEEVCHSIRIHCRERERGREREGGRESLSCGRTAEQRCGTVEATLHAHAAARAAADERLAAQRVTIRSVEDALGRNADEQDVHALQRDKVRRTAMPRRFSTTFLGLRGNRDLCTEKWAGSTLVS
jgi:hypothetical protein